VGWLRSGRYRRLPCGQGGLRGREKGNEHPSTHSVGLTYVW